MNFVLQDFIKMAWSSYRAKESAFNTYMDSIRDGKYEDWAELSPEERRALAKEKANLRCVPYYNRSNPCNIRQGVPCQQYKANAIPNQNQPQWIDLEKPIAILPYVLSVYDVIGPTKRSMYPLNAAESDPVARNCVYIVPENITVELKIAKQNDDYTWGSSENVAGFSFDNSAIIQHNIEIEEPGFYKVQVIQTKEDDTVIENDPLYYLVGALPNRSRLDYPILTEEDGLNVVRGGISLHNTNKVSKSLRRLSESTYEYELNWNYSALKDINDEDLEVPDRKFVVTAIYNLNTTEETKDISQNTQIYEYKIVNGDTNTTTIDLSDKIFTTDTKVSFYVQTFCQWKKALYGRIEKIQNIDFLTNTSTSQKSGFSFGLDVFSRVTNGLINTGNNIQEQLFIGSDIIPKNNEGYPDILNKKLFNKQSFNQFFKGNTLSLLEQAADQWMSYISFNDLNYRLIQSIYPNFDGIYIDRIIIDSPILDSGRAKHPTKTKIRFVPNTILDFDSTKQNTISMNMHIVVGGTTYSDYANNKAAILEELYGDEEKIETSIFRNLDLTNQQIINIFIHALGHGLGIGTFWNMPRPDVKQKFGDSALVMGLKYYYDRVFQVGPSLDQKTYPETVKAYNEHFVNLNRNISTAPNYLRKSARSIIPIDYNRNFITTVNEKELIVGHWTNQTINGYKGILFPAPIHDIMSGVGTQISSISKGYLDDVGYELVSLESIQSMQYENQSITNSGDLCSFNYLSLPEKVVCFDKSHKRIFVYSRQVEDPDPFEETSSDISDIQSFKYLFDNNKKQWISRLV